MPGVAGSVSGELVKWHGITVSFNGPLHNEMDSSPNPFLDYRLQVVFTAPSGQKYDVPGYFDGDGSGGETGKVWRVRFAPDEPGIWAYQASFHSGTNVAVSLNPSDGIAVSFDGDSGNFTVADLDINAEGFLKYGRLESVGDYYFKFRDGNYWIKGGMDSPENFLGYTGFDNTPNALNDFSTHVSDWVLGDPDWDSSNTPIATNDGRAIIGTLNYLASQHLNSIYFMPMNIGADGKDVWPYASTTIDRNGSASNDNVHFDLSKMHQWDIALDHAQRKSIFLHFVLSDREAANKNELDNATLGVERKLFYRELISRFGHYNALQWNISEEYNLALPLDPAVIKEFAQYINDVDPYNHPITVHNHGNTYVSALAPFVGDTRFGVMSVQTWQEPENISSAIEHFRTETANAGHIVPTAVDESIGLDQLSAAEYRKRAIWDAMLSGGGHELFVAYQDSSLDNFTTFEDHYRYLWYARKFVQDNLPFWEMTPSDALVTGENGLYGGAEVFAKEGEVYAIYLPAGNLEGTLSLGANSGLYEQRWYNPRTGQFAGSVKTVNAALSFGLGLPPSEINEDWVTVVRTLTAATSLFLQSTDSQGLVSMESESYRDNVSQGGYDWSVVVVGGQSGAASMEATPNTGTTLKNDYVSISPRLDYGIDFTQTGTHYVWIRGLGDSDGASVNDSIHVGLDGAAVNTSDNISGFNSNWSWTNTTMDGAVAQIDVATLGEHTLNVWMREDGVIIDKIVITTDAGFDPVVSYGDAGPPESPQGLPALAAPVIDPAPGSYFGMVTVSITAEPGALIYYTTDGSVPTTSSMLYQGSFDLTNDMTVQAIAVQSGWSDSPVSSASYVISLDLQPPTIDPAGGAYLNSVTVTMTPGASGVGAGVYYTTDGSTPTTGSTLYQGPFDVTVDTTVKAITALSGYNDSLVTSVDYTVTAAGAGSGVFLQPSTGQGLVSMESESYRDNVSQGGYDWSVVVVGGQSGAASMEATPNTGTTLKNDYVSISPRLDYGIDFTQTGTHYVWIRGLGDSDGASVNDSIHVGLDGAAVNTSDNISGFNSNWSWTNTTMDGAVAQIDVATLGEHTLNVWMREDGVIIDKIVITTDAGFDPVVSYGDAGPPESPQGVATMSAPVISPAGGTFYMNRIISITTTGVGTIRYTTDGTEPNEFSPAYQGPFSISSDVTIKAITISDDSNVLDSAVSEAVFQNTSCPDTRIMPLGDSITLGKDSFSLPADGFRVSYRRELYYSLAEAGFNVDFVGSQNGGDAAIPTFDSEHEGHAGWTDDQVAANVFYWLSINPADVVLLHIGTNSLDTNTSDVEFILNEIDRFDPNIEVVLARIINRQSYSALTTTFNDNIESMALARIASGDKIKIVDMESALISTEDFSDYLHPNISGYSKMSEQWFNILTTEVLPVCGG